MPVSRLATTTARNDGDVVGGAVRMVDLETGAATEVATLADIEAELTDITAMPPM